MQPIPFEQLIEAARSLEPQQRDALAQVLHLVSTTPAMENAFADVDAEVLNEAGAFSVFAPLPDEHPHAAAITDAQLIAATQCISCEWEDEPF